VTGSSRQEPVSFDLRQRIRRLASPILAVVNQEDEMSSGEMAYLVVRE
jgi:hypothetical protein